MRKRCIAMLLVCGMLLCGCGKKPADSGADTTTAKTTTAEQTEAATTAATTTAPQETGNPAMDGSVTAHLWEEYDLAFEYPSAYTLTPEEAASDDVEVLSGETDSTADGLFKMVVSEDSFTTDTFDGMEKIDLINMLGLSPELLVSGTFEEIKLYHLSGVEAAAKKYTTDCTYDGATAELTALAVNCFDTDCFYAMVYINTDDDYSDFCANLEEHFYLGNCQVHGGTVKQYLQGTSDEPQTVDIGHGCTCTLPADWRKSTDDDDNDVDDHDVDDHDDDDYDDDDYNDDDDDYDVDDHDDVDDDLEFVTAQGDYLLLETEDRMTSDSFEALMATQTVGSGSGGLTITGKEAHTVNGCPAYLVRQTRPSWGLSDADTVPVYSWYINADSGLIMISMIDVSGTQTDFILHPEEYLKF